MELESQRYRMIIWLLSRIKLKWSYMLLFGIIVLLIGWNVIMSISDWRYGFICFRGYAEDAYRRILSMD